MQLPCARTHGTAYPAFRQHPQALPRNLSGTTNAGAQLVPHVYRAQLGSCCLHSTGPRIPAASQSSPCSSSSSSIPSTRPCRRPRCATAAALSLPQLVPAAGPWGVWTGLILAGAFGMWSERTRLGKELSGALVATLAGMALANFGYLPAHAPEVNHVFKFLLPLAIPMLLYSANLVKILSSTGRLLATFLLGSACTVVGSILAMAIFPLTPLGEEGWKIAAALTARHIGGAVNYMAVSETLSISPSVFGAGLAADDLILTLYFTSLYALARNIPPEAGVSTGSSSSSSTPEQSQVQQTGSSSSSSSSDQGGHTGAAAKTVVVGDGMAAVALSATICYLATQVAAALAAPSQSITLITGITVALATLFPQQLGKLAPAGEGLAALLMQVFFAAVGASANVGLVVRTAPVLFCFSFIALGAHLALMLGVGRLLGLSRQELLLASNANIGGPATVAGMAAAKGWPSVLVPVILTSTLGYAIGTFIGTGLGYGLLKRMC